MSPQRPIRSSPPLGAPLPWVIAWRFLAGSRSRLLDDTARAALLATALGVTAMVVAMALMTGYREDLQSRLIGGNSPLLAQPLTRDVDPLGEATVERLESLAGVDGVHPVVYTPPGSALLSATATGSGEASREPMAVTLRGVDPGTGGSLGATAEQLGAQPGKVKEGTVPGEAVSAVAVPGAVLGRELAERLGVAVGDRLRLVGLGLEGDRPRFRYRSLQVSGLFDTGFAEFDSEWVILDRRLVTSLLRDGAYELYEFTLADPSRAPELAGRVEDVLGTDWLVTDWRELNRELFSALALQQLLLFLVLGLIVVVSTFNVASTLVVLVRERMRDIGVLAALGLAPRRLRLAFLLFGLLLGTAGTALGVLVGGGVAWTLNAFEVIRFDAEVAAIYFIRSVPFRVAVDDVAAVVVFSLLVNLAACWVPSWRAAAVDPAAALRYE